MFHALRLFGILVLLLGCGGRSEAGAGAASLPRIETLVEGFEKVVFGSELSGPFSDSSYLRKFTGPVRFFIDDRGTNDRRAEVAAFIRTIDEEIAGLETVLVRSAENADFVVHVADRADYQARGRAIYRNPFMRVPGNCIVRTDYSRRGIRRSDALIVSDEGDPRFRRCLVEEVLQGLGPLNENTQAAESVFNDTSTITRFTPYDRAILNMLYDPRLRPGMDLAETSRLLPEVARDVSRRLRQSTQGER